MYARSITYQKEYSFFLFGPRGTGKTTWVRQRFPEALHIDLLKDSAFTELAAHPDYLEKLIAASKASWVVIDEVQKLPPLLDEVHRLIETKKQKFVLTGSSARKLKRSGANLLAGRARVIEMHPLTAKELGASFDLRHSIKFGQLPAVSQVSDPEDFLKSYVSTYLKEEVQQEALVRNIGPFAKFLQAASFSQASLLNIQNVADDCGIKRKTAENHFHLLEDLLLAVRLPVFQRRSKRKTTQHPKFFFFDAGVYRAIRPKGPLDISDEIDGAAVETLVLQELRAHNANDGWGYELFFWRSQDQREVDFVLYGERGFWGIEVKRSARFREDDFKDLKIFLEDYPDASGLFLYGGDASYQFGKISVKPLAEALPRLGEIL